ncbi:MAG: diacylglycerol kinase family protein [Bacteroidia bacterium]|nr:diacylglycerol kinase family protein [Bacteroidia bacterium]
MKTNSFSLKARGESFRHAFAGLRIFFAREHNTWIHTAATVACVVLAIVTGVSRTEAVLLVLAAAIVWMTELINTAIERIMDIISKEKRVEIKHIKDISAAAVLVAAMTALCTGCIIFIPKLF